LGPIRLPDEKDPLVIRQTMGVFDRRGQFQLGDAGFQGSQDGLVSPMDGLTGLSDPVDFRSILPFALVQNQW